MIFKETNLTEVYEKLRLSMINSGNKIESQSQLVFLTQGMRSWLVIIKDIKILSRKQYPQASAPTIILTLKQTTVAVLTDMLLKVVKEEPVC